ncbi:MAG TPA: recombinase family protein [Gemmatimonadales bacterium]|jgi:DNA invertase Pin-like site-specific DNA recombinase
MHGIIYVRVSSGDQVAGTSLDSQERQCRAYCDQHRITVLEVFREEGESAKTADRTELLRAIAYCKTHKGTVSAFVVAKVDRFARNTEDHFSVRQLLQKCGVTLQSVHEPIGNTPTEKFIETVLAASAEFDNAVRRQRAIDGMSSKIQQGIRPSKPPLGYMSLVVRGRLDKKMRPDVPDPISFPIIQRALRAYLRGEIRTLTHFAQALDDWGLGMYRGKPTPTNTAFNMLSKNLSYYSGQLRNPWDGNTYTGRHVPMITPEEAARITLIHHRKARSWAATRERYNPAFPFRRNIRCSVCGKCFTGAFTHNPSGRRYPYYHCCNRQCSEKGHTIGRERLHDFVRVFLDAHPLRPAIAPLLDRSLQESAAARHDHSTDQRLVLTHTLEALIHRRTILHEMREDGSYDRTMFHERLAAVDGAIAQTQHDLGTTTNNPHLIDSARTVAEHLLREIGTTLFTLPVRTSSRLSHLLFPNGVICGHSADFRVSAISSLQV